MLHLALLSAGAQQQRTLALIEVAGVDIPRRQAPYTSAIVLGVTNLDDIIARIEALGLEVAPPNIGTGTNDSRFVEQAFIDFDGNAVLLYEWLESRGSRRNRHDRLHAG